MNIAKYTAGGLVLLGLAVVGWRLQYGGKPGTEGLTFTPEGRLSTRTTGNGDTIRYEYDQAGRLTKIKKSFFSSVGFQYNPASDLVSVRAPSGTTELRRDPFGRISRVAWANGKEVAYEFDPWGRVISLSASNGYQIKYSRNVLGQLTSVDDGHGRTSYEYSPQTVVRQLPNGVRTTFTFLSSGRVASITHRRADGGLIASFSYTYRPDGKVKALREETTNRQMNQSYEYDLVGRLSSVANADGERTEYTYDAVGNRKTETSGGRTRTFEYDSLGRLVKSGSVTYKYDGSGNLTLKRDAETGKATEYEYDVDDRLVAVRGAKRVRYTYDGLGNRVKREAGGDTSFYLNDTSAGLPQAFVVLDNAGRTTTQYLLADSRLGERDATGRTRYYLGDRMGTIRYVLNEEGQVEKECKYAVFGGPLDSKNDGQAGVCGYDGEIWDNDAKLLYLRRRYYDPTIGRFISADPYRGDLSNPRSLNRYAYAANDPVNRRDPSGLQDDGGGGFSFDAPVIDTGSSYSGSSLSQNFADNWNTPGPTQFQTADPAGPSFMDTVKAAASNLLAPAQSVLNATSNTAAAVASGSDAGQSALRTLLSGTDLATALGSVSKGFATGESFVSPFVAGYDLSQAQGAVAQTNAKVQLGTSIASSALGAAETWGVGASAVSGVGLPLAIAGLGEQGLETGMLAAGVPKETIEAAKYSAYTAAGQGFTGLNNLIGSLSQSISSGISSDLARSTAQFALNDALGSFGAGPLPASDVLQSVTGGNAPVGGVRLDRVAELIGTLGQISGAVYDPKTGRLVLVGDKNTVLPPMRLDDLGVALRAAYSADPAEPSMTIDPDPRDPRGPSMNVIFFGGTANTHFGWVMFEADRVMKTYSVGRDNITKAPIQSEIKGYYNIVQLGEANGRGGYKPHLWSRFWLVPESVKLRVTADGTGVVFDETKIRVCTETMRWVGGKLVSANPPGSAKDSSGSPCVLTSEKDESAEYFAKHFSDNYEEFAKESKIYGELKRIAQVYAVAKWMKKAGIQIDPQWVASLASQAYDTPRTTPSISNSISRTWQNGSGTRTESHSVFGGTELKMVPKFKGHDAAASAFAGAVRKGLLTTGGASEISINGRPQQAITLRTVTPPDYGSFRTSSLDVLAANSGGGANLQLLRSYTSFHTAPTSFGRGWSMLLPRLHFLGSTEKGESRTMSVQGVPGTTVALQQFHLTDDFSGLSRDFTEHFVDQEWKRIGFQSKPPSSRYRGLYPNPDKSYSLMFSNGDEWRFDAVGNLVAVRSGATAVDYRYETATTRVKEITSGSARIQLDYDSNQRIVRAVSSNGGDVRYSYDGDGNLLKVESGAAKIAYSYDHDHQLIGQVLNGRNLWSNEYDPEGHFVRQLDAANQVLQEQKFEQTKDGGRKIVQTRVAVVTTSTYDNRLRPLEVRSGNNVLTYTYYPSGAFKGLQGVRGDKARIEVNSSEDQRVVRSVDLRGTTREIRYDEHGRVAQISINGAPYVTYTRDGAGRPVNVDYGKVRENYGYGDGGRVTQYILEASGPEARSERIDLAYDQTGGIAKIATSLGSVEVRRDPGKQISLSAGDRTIRTMMDASGRASEVAGPAGESVKYRFGADQSLTGVSFSVDGQTGTMAFRQGRLGEQIDLGGGRTKYEYTDRGNLSAVVDPYGSATRYSYDEGDRLVGVLLANGRKVEYIYDLKRRKLQIREQ